MAFKTAGEIAEFNSLARDAVRSSQRERFPYSLRLNGVVITVHANVFSPKYCSGSYFYCKHMPPLCGKDVLDMGTGSGIAACLFAKQGAKVLAVDASEAAVANAGENVLRNQCTGVDVRRSDLFDSISTRRRFDYIFWNFPFLQVPTTYKCKSDLDRAIYDPRSRLLRRFIPEAIARLKREGRILLGWSKFADWRRLIICGRRNRLQLTIRAEEKGSASAYQLVEIGKSTAKAVDRRAWTNAPKIAKNLRARGLP